MIHALLLGTLTAWITALPFQLHGLLQRGMSSFSLFTPVAVLGITGLAMLLQRFVIDRRGGDREYDGLADLFAHIHAFSGPDPVIRWLVRGLHSFLLALTGMSVGVEGVAAEWAQALAIQIRVRTSIRFEHRRRTDAAIALGSAISAAFGAPFAGMLVPVELGIGGSFLPVAAGALVSSLWIHAFGINVIPDSFSGFRGSLNAFYFTWQEWLGTVVVGLLSGLISTALIRVIHGMQRNLFDLFGSRVWMRTITAGLLLFSLAIVYRSSQMLPSLLLERVLWYRMTGMELGVLFVVLGFCLSLVLSGFGTLGVFWPVFVMGGVFGVGVNQWVLHDLPDFSIPAGLIGGAAFFSGVLGAPLAGAVLVYELTDSLPALLLGLIAGYLSRTVVRYLKTPGLVERNLESRGLGLLEGRSTRILDQISVKDALSTDFETVFEYESIHDLQRRFLRSRYPWLPVVGPQGQYQGLLTVDMMHEAREMQEKATRSNPGLGRLIEAKDLLYRTGFKVPTVKISDRLSATGGVFETTPCVPALTEDGRVAGLLLNFNVRLAYDREVARRSLEQEKVSR